MDNYTQNTYELKRNIANFAKELSNGYHKPKISFVADMLYGIAASNSLMLSEISHNLNSNIQKINHIKRLSKKLTEFDSQIIENNLVKIVKPMLPKENKIFIVDDSDITKPYGNKFEDLDYVKDGSSKKGAREKGYHVTTIVGLSDKYTQPICLHNEIYSTKSKGFESKKTKLHLALNKVINNYGLDGTFIFDRGFDDVKLFKLLNCRNVNYICRVKNNRKFFYQSKIYTSNQLKIKCKGKINLNVEFQDEKISLKASHLKVGLLSDKKVQLNAVIIHGFGKDPMALLTNREIIGKEDVKQVVFDYLKRWRIEEYFRYVKTQYGFENMRVRSLDAINNLSLFMNLIVTLQTKILENDSSLLIHKILKQAKGLRKKVILYFYQINLGIKTILNKSRTDLSDWFKKEHRPKEKQLCLNI